MENLTLFPLYQTTCFFILLVAPCTPLLKNIEKVRNYNIPIGAIQTTMKFSLLEYKNIIDTYISNGFNGIFLRPLTELGFAKEEWNNIGYSAKEFLEFYRNSFEYIIEWNRKGMKIREQHAAIFLSKILGGRCGNYTELRSPCGATVGQLAYYPDGNIYTCDEGRKLAKMGDCSFKVGNVENNYNEITGSSVCKSVCVASCLESIPECSECVYSPYCGVCPVTIYGESHNLFFGKNKKFRCEIYKGIMKLLFKYI